jgi:uncharacterized protein YcaQ
MFEYWGHEASLLPAAHRPLLAHRMRGEGRWRNLYRFGREHAEFVGRVLQDVRERGPVPSAWTA